MLPVVRSFRTILRHPLTLAVYVAFLFASAAGVAQSLRFVPPIYTVPLPSLNMLSGPTALATDVHGNVYMLDTGHSQVLKVDTSQTTTIFAGTGSGTYSGDNGLAVNASLHLPNAIAVDLAGNVFIADTNNFAIRRVDAVTGIITTIAGGNGPGYSGDNGPALSAKFQGPTGLAVDAADNIYVADSTSTVIRRISSAGIITTFAGGGTPASGNGDGGPALNAKLTSPYGLALDAIGNLFIADLGASVVREVATNNVITTFAGSTKGNSGMGGPATSAQLNSPRALAIDAGGNIYIADGGTGLLTVVDSSKNINVLSGLTVFGGVGDGLPASVVQLASPFGVAVDPYGNVFVDSNTSNALYEIVQHPEQFPMTRVGKSSTQQRLIVQNTGSTTINISAVTAGGDFAITTAIINSNYRPCASSYKNLTASSGNNFCTIDVIFTPSAAGVRSAPLTLTSNDTPATTTSGLTSTGLSPTVAVSGGEVYTIAGMVPANLLVRTDNVLATTASLGGLNGLAFDSGGNLFLSEYGLSDVRRVDAKTDIISLFAGSLNGTAGPAQGDGGPATQAVFDGIGKLVVAPDNTVYIPDGLNYEIRSVDPQGIVHRFAGNGSNICNVANDGSKANAVPVCGAAGIARDSAGNIYFSEGLVNAIRKVDTSGVLSTVGGVFGAAAGYSGDGGAALSAHLNNPWSIAIDNKDNIFLADVGNDIVRRIDANSHVITTVAGMPGVQGYSGDGGLATKATLTVPYGLAVDAAGNLYIGDSGNNVIRKVDAATGVISTLAGNHNLGGLYNGDGLTATATAINYPEVVAVDPSGTVVFSDRNGLVRKIDPNGLIDFGDQKVSTASSVQTVTVSNIGNLPLHFDSTTPYAIDGDFTFTSGGTCDFTQALAAGASCTVRVTFTPSSQYERYGTMNLYDDGIGSPQITELRGNGISPLVSQAVLTPNPVAFANQVINTTSASQTLTLSNPGTSTLNISGISIVGANPTNFTITPATTCGSTLAAGATCSIFVTFTPTSVASFTATVMVSDDAAGSPHTATVNGAGIAAPAPMAVLTPAGLTFASQTSGTTSASQSFTLANNGNAVLNISGITIGGANASNFAMAQSSTCGATLAAGANCSIAVTFSPSSAGTFSATVNVADNAVGSPQTGSLNGTGTAPPAPQAVLTPAGLTFAAQTVATTSASQSFTLSNPGNATLNISGITLGGTNAGSFAQTTTCGATLAAGASCAIAVTFTPGSSTALSATVSVADNAAGSPQTGTLSGTGLAVPVPPDFSVSASPPAATVSGGSSAVYNITLASVVSTNPFTGVVTLSASGLPTGATATFAPPTATPGATSASSVLTIVTPKPAVVSAKIAGLGAGVVSAGFVLLCFAGRRRRRGIPRLLMVLFALTASGLCTAAITGCGGGGFALPGAAAQTYTITVTGTSGSVQHSTTVTLTVN